MTPRESARDAWSKTYGSHMSTNEEAFLAGWDAAVEQLRPVLRDALPLIRSMEYGQYDADDELNCCSQCHAPYRKPHAGHCSVAGLLPQIEAWLPAPPKDPGPT